MGRPRKETVSVLQANDPTAYTPVVDKEYLTDEAINEAYAPYKQRGVRLELTNDHWILTMRKEIYDIRGKSLGGGDVSAIGNRKMPIKDFIYSINQFVQPIAPPAA